MTAVSDDTVLAAGGVVWRPGAGGPEVCLVHRPRYDDWSLPKGKLRAGEHPLAGAVREVAEETGVAALPQVRLPTIGYLLAAGAPKRVDYWFMRAVDGPGFTPNREVDELRWVPLAEAAGALSYDHDTDVVRAAAALPAVGAVVVLLRHAYAGERDEWTGPDAARPLDERGRRQAGRLAEVLAVFGPGLCPGSLRTASPDRCRQTVEPLAGRLGLPIEPDPAFDEVADPTATVARLRELTGAGDAGGAAPDRSVTIVSSQGKLLPKVLGLLAGQPPDGYATRKGDGWLIAFPADRRADVVGLDRLTI
jgi:8-oxo-dGTP diphosphatase